MNESLWLYPLLKLLSEHIPREELARRLGVSSRRLKTLLYYSKKFNLINGNLELTEKGRSLVRSYEVLEWEGNRILIKGEDGCFKIIIRKKGIKSFRVPCSSETTFPRP